MDSMRSDRSPQLAQVSFHDHLVHETSIMPDLVHASIFSVNINSCSLAANANRGS